MIAAYFKKRRVAFQTQCLKYLRYVLNDHFVLALLFLSGFLLVEYSKLLRQLPENRLPLMITLGLFLLGLPFLSSLSTYIEAADQQYLLVKELEIWNELKASFNRSLIRGQLAQLLVVIALSPLLIKLGLSVLWLGFLIFGLGLVRYAVLSYKFKKIGTAKQIYWEEVIQQEKKRKQTILSFFALFTQVKGLTTAVKRRAYLDRFLAYLPQSSNALWLNLYVRAFLRSGDYLGLTFRLLMLSLLMIIFVPQQMIAVGLVLLFNYLLVFQLIGLIHVYDYQYLTRLYPKNDKLKEKGLQQVIRVVGYLGLVVQLMLAVRLGISVLLLGLILGQIVLLEIYLPYKIRKSI